MFNASILPGKTIGIVGGGQLGQMMAQSAKEMGYKIAVLDPVANCPASSLADHFFCGKYDDLASLQALNEVSDVLTYEFENVDWQALETVVPAEKLPQGTTLLSITQNRRAEKKFLKEQKLPVVDYLDVNTEEELIRAVNQLGLPCVLKTAQGGYDGKGQVVIESLGDILEALTLLKAKCVLEKWLVFEREISVIVAGNEKQECVVFPVAENCHRHNILHQTIVPARVGDMLITEAKKIGLAIANALSLSGVLAIEMFVTKDGTLYVNELAPRPHNSGHYSIEACDFSQFDLHIKGICNLPLTEPVLLKPAIMMNLLGQHVEKSYHVMTTNCHWHFHYYGKEQAKKDRKMGHMTCLTDNLEATLAEIEQLKIWGK